MKKSALMLFAFFLSMAAIAQNVPEGVNHLYAQRYASAQSTFEKLLAANPNNIEANYWLGQTFIAQKNIAAAKSLYEKAAAASNNAPLLVVGQGHIALLEGRSAEARQFFENAINASRGRKGNDANILNAVGRANVDAYTEANKLGDLNYAIAKLTEASQIAPNNADIYLNLGNAYRKKRDSGSGGKAIENYMKAKQVNPAMAAASYRQAMIYKTQVNYRSSQDQWKVVLDNLNAAIQADPKFAPAYEELYYYNLLTKKDFVTAENFANQYISSSDPSVENDYLKAQTVFVQNKFDEAINIGKNILSKTNNNAKPRVFRLLGYSYLGAKDTATACQYVDQFFAKASEEDIIGEDYILHAQSCGNNNPEIIRADLAKMVELDSLPAKKIQTLRDFARDAKASGQRLLEAEINVMAMQVDTNFHPTRLINDVTLPYYFAGAYLKADSAAKAYSALQPDSIYGYHWSALALSGIDTTMEQGLAMESFQKTLQIAETDKIRFKSQGIRAAQTLAIYYNNIKADKTAALEYVNRGLAFDPNHSTLQQIGKMLQQPAPKAAPKTPAKGTQKSSSSSSAAKDVKVKTENGKTKVKQG